MYSGGYWFPYPLYIEKMGKGKIMGKKQEKESIYARDLKYLIDYRREENNERLWNIIQSIIPMSSLDRITLGYHAEDKIVMDRMLRRVGIDPAEIEMIIFKRDAERFSKRMEIYKVYNQKQYDKLERLLQEYEEETKEMHLIHQQFVKKMRAWMMIQQNKNMSQIIPILKEAINYTVPNFGKVPLRKISLAPEEMELLILLASCYRRRNELTRAKVLLKEIFYYARNRRMSEDLRSSYVPFACLELSKVCEAELQYEDARYYALTGIKILCGNAKASYLVALQEQYLRIEQFIAKKQKLSSWRKTRIEQIKEERKVLVELYKESKLDPYRLYPTDGYQSCYIFNELLIFYRNFWKLSRKNFYKGICTATAYMNIEKGTSDPKKTFNDWMERIGWPQTYYMIQLHGGNTDHIKLYFRIDHYIRRQQYEKAKELSEQLEKIFDAKHLKDICPENKQYFLWIRTVLEREMNGISPEENESRLKEALHLTISENENVDFSNYPLRRKEMRLLNSLAAGYAGQEKYEKCIEIWTKLEKNYLNKWICQGAQYDEKNLIAINNMSRIGSNGDYKLSNQKTYEIVKRLLEEGTTERMLRCCYNIAWNREQEIIKQNKDVKKSSLYQKKLKQAEVLARMLDDTFYIGFLEAYRKQYS